MRRVAYGSLAHVLNMVLYLMGQLPLTYLTLALRPSVNTTLPGQLDVEMVPVSFSEVLVRRDQRAPGDEQTEREMNGWIGFGRMGCALGSLCAGLLLKYQYISALWS